MLGSSSSEGSEALRICGKKFEISCSFAYISTTTKIIDTRPDCPKYFPPQDDLDRKPWFNKNIYTKEPHVVELITEYNDDYKENDTPRNEWNEQKA